MDDNIYISIIRGVKQGASDTFNSIKSSIEEATAPIASKFEEVKNKAAETFKPISDKASEVWNGVSDAAIFGLNVAVGAGAEFGSFLAEQFKPISDAANEAFDSVSEAVSEKWQSITDTANEVWNGVTDTVSSVASDISETASSMWDGMSEAASTAFEGVSDTISSAMSSVGEAISPVWDSISEAASVAWDSISNSASQAWEGISAAFSPAASWFESTVWSPISSAVGGVKETIVSAFTSAVGAIKSAWGSLVGWFESNIIGPIKEKFSALASIGSSITGLGGGGGAAAKAEGGFLTAPQHILAGEAGPEVIIPLSVGRRNRARDLLTKTLNILNGNADAAGFNSNEKLQPQSSQEETDELGNLKAYQGMSDNLIKVGDLSPIIDAKLREQRKYVHNQRKQSEELQIQANQQAQEARILSSIPSYETDELGNLKGYTGSSENLVQHGDLSPIRDAKISAQRQAMENIGQANEINVPLPEPVIESEAIELATATRTFNRDLETDELGNLKGYTGSEENLVRYGDLSPIRDAKLRMQRESMASIAEIAADSSQNIVTNKSLPISSMPTPIMENEIVDMPETTRQYSNFERDEFGNIKGYSGITDNLIQAGYLSPIRDVKIKAQEEFMSRQHQEQVIDSSVTDKAIKANEGVAPSRSSQDTTNSVLETDELGNIKGYDGLKDNLINASDDSLVRQAKQRAQKKAMGIDSSTINSPTDMASASNNSVEDIPMPTQEPTPDLTAFDSLERDELGNFKGYTGMQDNLVQAGDLSPIRDAKLAVQEAEMSMPEFAPDDNETLPSADEMPISNNSSSNVSIELGSITPTFQIEGGDNPQAIVEAIRSQIEDVADLIGGTIAEKMSAIHGNQGVLT